MAKRKEIFDGETLKQEYTQNGLLVENIYIGIDTGVHTGFAVWSATKQKFIDLAETKIHRAMFRILRYAQCDRYRILGVRVEDARKRSVDKSNPIYYQRLQSAGSIKRDASCWEDFLKDYKKIFPFQMVAPQSNTTKIPEDEFLMKYHQFLNSESMRNAVSSEHIRDACMLVINFRNVPMVTAKRKQKQQNNNN